MNKNNVENKVGDLFCLFNLSKAEKFVGKVVEYTNFNNTQNWQKIKLKKTHLKY